MPPKRERKKDVDRKKKKDRKKIITEETKLKDSTLCIITPGPKYRLKTLVGFKEHCISKFRNPAYTFGGPRPVIGVEKGPGPKYMIKERKPIGFSFGLTAKRRDIHIGPGPKFKLPDISHGPFFSIKWRTKPRQRDKTPGPYYVKPIVDAPAFTMGLRTPGPKPKTSAGPYPRFGLNITKPRDPIYSMGRKLLMQVISRSPGPIYALKSPKITPAFSFGIKHGKCAPPYITECDDQC